MLRVKDVLNEVIRVGQYHARATFARRASSLSKLLKEGRRQVAAESSLNQEVKDSSTVIEFRQLIITVQTHQD